MADDDDDTLILHRNLTESEGIEKYITLRCIAHLGLFLLYNLEQRKLTLVSVSHSDGAFFY